MLDWNEPNGSHIFPVIFIFVVWTVLQSHLSYNLCLRRVNCSYSHIFPVIFVLVAWIVLQSHLSYSLCLRRVNCSCSHIFPVIFVFVAWSALTVTITECFAAMFELWLHPHAQSFVGQNQSLNFSKLEIACRITLSRRCAVEGEDVRLVYRQVGSGEVLGRCQKIGGGGYAKCYAVTTRIIFFCIQIGRVWTISLYYWWCAWGNFSVSPSWSTRPTTGCGARSTSFWTHRYSSGNGQETETCMIRACHAPWHPLQHHPKGHLGEWATSWSAEEMLYGPRPELHTMASCRIDWKRVFAESSAFSLPHPNPQPPLPDDPVGQGTELNWGRGRGVRITRWP